MTRSIVNTIIALFLFIQGTHAQRVPAGNIHIGFLYPLSNNWIYAMEYTNVFSLHAIAGVSGSERAFCAAGATNIIKNQANGLIAGGFSNHILGRARGVQAAGFLNTIRNEAAGLTAAGFMNITGSSSGMQAAGFGNITKRHADGVQAAGFINIAADAQTQLAGFINIARHVKGVQIAGFINIADSNDYPIGFINIISKGEKSIGLTVDETLTTLVSFRSGGHILYGILGAGINLTDDKPLYALEAGLGARLPLTPHFRMNMEGRAMTLADFERGIYFRSSLHLFPSLKIGNKLELFAGPTINHVSLSRDKGGELTSHYLWSANRCGYFYGLYLGASGGIQLHF